jgi:hypothetical protein
MRRACFFTLVFGDVDGEREQAVRRILLLKKK